MFTKKIEGKKPKYRLNNEGEFIIENYNFSRPFANFFPGIAGRYGIPMWTFYVNRGQAISSFGTKDKDHAILEFFPANKTWQLVTSYGFRTFLKINSKDKIIFYEPFHNGAANIEFDLTNKMYITSHKLKLEEENRALGLNITVEYFNIPSDCYAGLARIVKITNSSNKDISAQLIDGLPQIVPFGTNNFFLKKLGRTIEAWMKAKISEEGLSFYKLDVDPVDRPEVIHIKGANFYLPFYYENKKIKHPGIIIDPQEVFGPVTDFSLPYKFVSNQNFKPAGSLTIESRMPSAFSFSRFKLPGKESRLFYSVIGFATNTEHLKIIASKFIKEDYLKDKDIENKKIIENLTKDVETSSSSKEFNLYVKQTYLDNILRGGYPVIFGDSNLFYLYSRKHGDLERDYNKFQLQPSYLSQGNGNYRDTNQNRRCNIWFNPKIQENDLVTFVNLIQTDGFNPLVLKGTNFVLEDTDNLKKHLAPKINQDNLDKLLVFLKTPFTPGELVFFIENNGIKLSVPYDELLEIILGSASRIQEAEHGEGFWTDHWTYNLDLLETYLEVYPERIKEIFFETRLFTFFDNSQVVKPRKEKYLLYGDSPRQSHATTLDNAKKEMIKKRTFQSHLVRCDYGMGKVYQTTLVNKLLCLLVNKLASLDPFGIGIEMEADKPNWFDALNGLPALFGSSLAETLELKRLVYIVKASLETKDLKNIPVTEEIRDLLIKLNGLMEEFHSYDSQEESFLFWDKSHSLKEEYRQKTKFGLSGKEIDTDINELVKILDNALRKINAGISKARDKKESLYCTYFINEVTEYEIVDNHMHFIKPKCFAQKKLPLFLEGQMHALRVAENIKVAKSIYSATRSSELYDKKLKMYKVTAPLSSMPQEIGRCRIFTPGWLENESIWLHMEYKFLLEILKQGLYQEFFDEIKNTFIPFQNPARYGRSILENSSFLVSSAFPDKNLHGNGFVARLSGSTAELIQIWLIMNLGHKPFFLNKQNELNLRFSPILPGWLFDNKGRYSFNFLTRTRVNYHNPGKKDTFGKNKAKVKTISFLDKYGNTLNIESDTVPSEYASQIRSGLVEKIDILFV